MTLLSDQKVYQESKDLTKSIYNKVIKQLSDLNNNLCQKCKDLNTNLCPPGDNSPTARFYGLQKIHKPNVPSYL